MFTTITFEVHVLKYYNLPIPWIEWNHPKSNISYHRVHRLPGLPYSHLPRIAKGCHHHFTRAVERPGHARAPMGWGTGIACLDLLRWVCWWVWFSHGPHVQQIPTCHFMFLCFCDFLDNFVGSSVSVLGLHGPRQQHKCKSARVKWVKHKHTPIYFDAVWKNATKSVWKQIWEGNSGICKQNSNYNHLTVVSYAKETKPGLLKHLTAMACNSYQFMTLVSAAGYKMVQVQHLLLQNFQPGLLVQQGAKCCLSRSSVYLGLRFCIFSKLCNWWQVPL